MQIKTEEIKFRFIFMALFCGVQAIEGLKILALFPLHGKSHFLMCEKLAKELAANGHEIDVYSHFPQNKQIPNYNDFSLKGTLPVIVNNMSYDSISQFRTPKIELMLSEFGCSICDLMDTPKFQELFERLEKKNPYDIVIVETFISDCYLGWGRYLNIPMIGVMTSSLIDWYNPSLGNPVNTAITPGVWSSFRYPMSFTERLLNTIIYYTINAQFMYHIGVQNKYIQKYFGPDMPNIRELSKDLDLLLVNTHYSLDGIRPFTPAIVPVGGLHINDDGQKLPDKVQKWLDESKDGCIYFSFGSMVRIETFPRSTLDVFYATFKNIAPVRVLFKIAKPEVLPPGLPSNVMTQSWFSQVQVLKHKNIKAFVTHGGLGSSQESIYAGVPLVGFPLYGDQPVNLAKLARKNVAIILEMNDMSEEVFTAALKEILYNPTYKQSAEKLSREFNDRPVKPATEAVFWVEYIARHGKGALRSPIVDMPWWQANLIDVYGFISLVVLLTLYLFVFVLLAIKKIIKRLFSSSTPDKKKIKKVKKNN